MQLDRVWYHVIWNTHGSWLPGDPRGFRNHDHRIHSSGDYKNPPPTGEHQGLHDYNLKRSSPPVMVPAELRILIADAVLTTLKDEDCEPNSLAIDAEHVHLLARMPGDYTEAKKIVGKCKTYSSLAVRDQMPGTVWARGCALKRIADEDHLAATVNYILHKQNPRAFTWGMNPNKRSQGEAESTARAVASIDDEDDDSLLDATAQAVDSADSGNDFDPNLFQQSDAIEVRRVINRGKGGRAVMARRDIAEGEVIERVPVLLIPRTQVFGPGDIASRAARISWYVFEWLPTKRGYVALSLGYGSIYNHSDDPNAAYDMELPDVMIFSAIKPIAAGEEVLISYAGAAGVMKELGFEVEKTPPLAPDQSPTPATGQGREEDA